MMEFATENYLSDLLINTESNGFESAKESFYECIAIEGKLSDAYDMHVVGGVFQTGMNLGSAAMGYGKHGDKEPSTARQVAGAIIAVPVGILTFAITAALSIIGLIVKLIDAIIGLLAKMFRVKIDKSVLAKLNADMIKFRNTHGKAYAEAFTAFEKAIIPAVNDLAGICGMMADINARDQTENNGHIRLDFVEDTEKLSNTAEECNKLRIDAENAKFVFDSKFDKFCDENEIKLPASEKYLLVPFDLNKVANLKKTVEALQPRLKKYSNTLETYRNNLTKTMQKCKKAKSNGEKKVNLDSNDAVASEGTNKLLKLIESIVKNGGKFISLAEGITISYNSISDSPKGESKPKSSSDESQKKTVSDTGKAKQNMQQSISQRHKESAKMIKDSLTNIYQDKDSDKKSSKPKDDHDKDFKDMNDALDKLM